jgi:hypothetical protein
MVEIHKKALSWSIRFTIAIPGCSIRCTSIPSGTVTVSPGITEVDIVEIVIVSVLMISFPPCSSMMPSI